MKGKTQKVSGVAEVDLTGLVLNDLEGAAKMLGQALNRPHPSLDIFKSIKTV